MSRIVAPMASVARFLNRFFRPPEHPQSFSATGFRTIDKDISIEEEKVSFYSAQRFYPLRIGQVLNSRYQAIGKLGFGGYSTVWLCRDLKDHVYVALKLCRSDAPHLRREIDVYEHLNRIKTNKTGASLVRTMVTTFNLKEHGHIYPCIVHKPLGLNLVALRQKMPQRQMPESILKLTLIHLLIAVDFLHVNANVVHADIQEKNILLDIEDGSILKRFQELEHEDPIARKIDGERIIYETRKIDNATKAGRPVLTDFGEARMGSSSYHGVIQPDQYRAPEVLLEIAWDHKVDIWNIGTLIWNLFYDRNLFRARDEKGDHSRSHHLAEMVAILGPPPPQIIRSGAVAAEYFNADGSWKGPVEIPDTSLEDLEQNLEGDNKALFLRFVRKMLTWSPEERSSAEDLLRDPWLRDGDHFLNAR